LNEMLHGMPQTLSFRVSIKPDKHVIPNYLSAFQKDILC